MGGSARDKIPNIEASYLLIFHTFLIKSFVNSFKKANKKLKCPCYYHVNRENFDIVSFRNKKQLNFCTELQNGHICRREELFMCAITIDIV